MHEESLARHWHEDDVWHAPFSAMDVHDDDDSDASIDEDVVCIEIAPSANTTAATDAAARHDERSSLA